MLNKIGINAPLLSFQIVNFLILLVVLKKLLYKPVLEAIEKRKKEAEEGIALKEKLERKKEEIEKEHQFIIQEAREEAQLLIEQKKKEAQKIKNKILEQAQSQKKEILASGKKESKQLKIKMQKSVEREALDAAAEIAEKILHDVLDDKKHHELINKQLIKYEHISRSGKNNN